MKLLKNTFALSTISLSLMTLVGCQSVHSQSTVTKPVTSAVTTSTPNAISTSTSTPNVAVQPSIALPQKFEINGKIGITTPQQAGSAFYTWGQDGNSFAIDLAGALNAGQTQIRYNGQTATLTNEKGTMTATSPEELLFKATKWQAPISQLPYWIMGQAAPSDSGNKNDSQNRLATTYNGDWTADFSYNNKDTLPNRITMKHPQGYKVVLTINRLG